MVRRVIAASAVLLVTTSLVAVPASSAVASAPATSTLTNLAHLDALTSTVTPSALPGHTTYRLASQPAVGVLWVYANHLADGSYQPTGGGPYDAATNTYGQGAYDADDITRAAVVYLRHWAQWHDRHSRDEAYQLLRGLTYLQTASGRNAGNVVLWMQPDGTLNPSPIPKETPDPSDSGASYWLARTVWALGEGYAAFRRADGEFAAFLKQRLDLAVRALDRQVLVRYGHFQVSNGLRMPDWLITGGADATSEAVLGLAAYVRAGGTGGARTALAKFADGIAAMGQGSTDEWPYGALLPWTGSRSTWHAWGAQMPGALAAAAAALHAPRLLNPAIADSAQFTPHLFTATGPDNGWLPTPVDGSQIAYGADARVQGLLAVAKGAHSVGLRQLAGIAAGWFFGQNPAGVAIYDPQTGVTHDGVSPDGNVNLNSGAESTIHGLLTMEALDANPDVAVIAHASAHLVSRDGQRTLEAEAATLSGPATVVQANPAYTGEAQWSGGAYVELGDGGGLTWTVPSADQPRLLQAVVNRVPGPAGTIRFTAAGARLGGVAFGGGGAQGSSATPGALLPISVGTSVPGAATTLSASTTRGGGQLDAIQLTPLLSVLITDGAGHGTTLVNSAANSARSIVVPSSGPTVATSYDSRGRVWRRFARSGSISVTVPAGGFAIIRR